MALLIASSSLPSAASSACFENSESSAILAMACSLVIGRPVARRQSRFSLLVGRTGWAWSLLRPGETNVARVERKVLLLMVVSCRMRMGMLRKWERKERNEQLILCAQLPQKGEQYWRCMTGSEPARRVRHLLFRTCINHLGGMVSVYSCRTHGSHWDYVYRIIIWCSISCL